MGKAWMVLAFADKSTKPRQLTSRSSDEAQGAIRVTHWALKPLSEVPPITVECAPPEALRGVSHRHSRIIFKMHAHFAFFATVEPYLLAIIMK